MLRSLVGSEMCIRDRSNIKIHDLSEELSKLRDTYEQLKKGMYFLVILKSTNNDMTVKLYLRKSKFFESRNAVNIEKNHFFTLKMPKFLKKLVQPV